MIHPELAVDMYIQAIGSTEPDYNVLINQMSVDHPFYPSMLIGRGCLLLANDPTEPVIRNANIHFQHADEILGQRLKAAYTPWEEGPLSLVQHTARTLICRDNPDLLQLLATDLRERTVNTISWLCTELDDPKTSEGHRRQIAGTLPQQVAFGLYTRSEEATILPTMALAHHDCGPRRQQNYDLLAIYPGNTNKRKKPRISKMQIKAGCLGLDPDHRLSNPGLKDYVRSRSAENIVLVSGCCDMDMRATGPDLVAEFDTQTGPDTQQEETSSLTTRQRKRLNRVSHHMQGIVFGTDTWDRYGTAPIEQNNIFLNYATLRERLTRTEELKGPAPTL